MTTDFEELWFSWGVHVPTRSLYLEPGDSGEVDQDTSSKLIKGLKILEKDCSEYISLYINSPGGSVVDGLAIYDIIKQSKCQINGYVYGECSSIASIVLQACDYRISSGNATFLLHEGSTTLSGNTIDVIRQAEAEKQACQLCYDIYAERSNETKAFYRRKLANDWILNAKQMLNLGLIDEIR